ncbi:hypothetical protein SDC9_00307 [bioreactor metagenome]|uniref:O-antigen ligase-related domain-containing protein n=1 Tax=bioreactor metagenome TaxID=1076179 RepID=A0A644SM27_9ZZZZ
MKYRTTEYTGYITKWAIVCLLLLLVPYSQILLFGFFIYKYFSHKYDSIDIVILFFLMFFVQNIVPIPEQLTIVLRYSLVLSLLVKAVLFYHSKILGSFSANQRMIVVFLIYVLINSLIISVIPLHSLKQLPLFLLLFIVSSFGAKQFSHFDFSYKIKNIESLYMVVLVMSILALPIPSISYYKNFIGFSGISVHPNALGIFLSPFSGYALARFFRTKKRYYLIFFIISFASIYLSQSRTSLFSIFLGFIVFFSVNNSFRKLFSRKLLLLVLPLLLTFLLFSDQIQVLSKEFLLKSGDDTFVESVKRSRGDLLQNQIANIDKNPILGIGFKVPSNKSLDTGGEDKLYYEKGNMLTATIEELGFTGLLLMLLVFIFLIRRQGRFTYNTEYQLLPIIAIFTTLGEATLFAIGGLGTFIWLLIFLSKSNYYNGNTIEN